MTAARIISGKAFGTWVFRCKKHIIDGQGRMRSLPVFLFHKHSPYQNVKNHPARGESTIMTTEKVKEAIEISVARCAEEKES